MDDAHRSSAAHEVTVDASASGQRIDNFLATHLKGVPRTRIYRLLRRGEVRVNRGRVRQHYRLAPGDVVRVPPVRAAAGARPRKTPAETRQRAVERAILYEDDGLIVLNKPAGWAVHGGSGLDFGVIECLRAARPGARRLELVHRLDRDTSGCLLVAKRRGVLSALHEALREERVRKGYLALVRGGFGARRRCEAPLLREQRRTGERIVRVHTGGKRSVTDFLPVEAGEAASLVMARPRTGRTHQIRVHALSLHAPLAGDEKYGDRAFNRLMRSYGLKRLFLHAASVAIPAGNGWVEFEAPLPPDLAAVLVSLGFGGGAVGSRRRPPAAD